MKKKCKLCGGVLKPRDSWDAKTRIYCSPKCYWESMRKGHKKPLKKKEIVKAYESGLNAYQIAQEYGCGSSTIYRILDKAGCKRRHGSEVIPTRTPFLRRKEISTEAIVKDYLSGMSPNDLARKYKCDRKAVIARLRKRGIKIRSSSEGVQLFMDGQKGGFWKKDQRKRTIASWKKPEFQKKQKMRTGIKPNKTESALDKLFKKEGLGLKYVGDYKKGYFFGGKNPDWSNKDKTKVVEYFGVFYHKKGDERKRKRHFEKLGMKCWVIWGDQIQLRNGKLWGDTEGLIKSLRAFLKKTDF